MADPGEEGKSHFQSYHIIRFKCPVFNKKKSQIAQISKNVWAIQRKLPVKDLLEGFTRQRLENGYLKDAHIIKKRHGESKKKRCINKMKISIKRKI